MTSLHLACCSSTTEIINILIEAGANVNVPDNVSNTLFKNKRTPLHMATSNGHLEAIEILVNAPNLEINA